MSSLSKNLLERTDDDAIVFKRPPSNDAASVSGHDGIPEKRESTFSEQVWYYITLRGLDNVHIYLWILKDLGWTLGNKYLAYVTGVSALLWCGLLFAICVWKNDVEDGYMTVTLTLWLAANFWWMCAEVDIQGDDDTNALQTSYIMETGIGWAVLYYVLWRPLDIIKENKEITADYLAMGLLPRFSYFLNWRQYEHLHTLLWLGKDFSWNRMFWPTWVIFAIPTVLIAIDFMYCTYQKRLFVDFVHYVSQFLWIISNLVWAGGELFDMKYDDPYPLGDHSKEAVRTCRWWSAIILLVSLIPIGLLFFVWFPYRYFMVGRILDDFPELRTKSSTQATSNNKDLNESDTVCSDSDMTIESLSNNTSANNSNRSSISVNITNPIVQKSEQSETGIHNEYASESKL
jgi:hypothetical protein